MIEDKKHWDKNPLTKEQINEIKRITDNAIAIVNISLDLNKFLCEYKNKGLNHDNNGRRS